MELITYYLSQGLSFLIPLIILLGLLIFVHELGHFLVAKYFGVRVEVFSLGFGKKFFKYKKGDTEYCLSIIPFGGYVKMYGDDPTAEIPAESRKYSFTHKPVGQRIGIVLAGPLMNFFFAIVLFTLIAFVGEEVIRPVVGDIAPTSRAYLAGLRSEDTVVAVNNQTVTNWTELKDYIEKNGSGPIQLSVLKPGATQPENIQTRTDLVPNPNILSSLSEIGELEGLSFYFRASEVAVTSDTSLAAKSGLKTGDLISKVESTEITKWIDLARAIATSSEKDEVSVVIERVIGKDKTEKQTLTLSLKSAKELAAKSNQTTTYSHDLLIQKGHQILMSLGFDYPDLYVSDLVPESAAASAGIQKGDKIVSVNGEISEWNDLVKRVQAYTESQPPLKVSVLRNNQPLSFEIVPRKISQPQPTGKEIPVYAMGVLAGVSSAQPLTFVSKILNPTAALSKGFSDTILWTKNTCLSFLRLLQNRVSAKSIGGPIMIGQLASKTFQIGISPFMKIMAIISINLFILNLLPVPVLDGGHLVFFTIEALRGAPLSMRKMEIAQQIGLVILMSLMVLALFNDVSRLFN